MLVYCDGGKRGGKYHAFHERRGRVGLYRFSRSTPPAPIINGRVPVRIGEHVLFMEPPQRYHWSAEPVESNGSRLHDWQMQRGQRHGWADEFGEPGPGERPPGRGRPPAITYLLGDVVLEDQAKVDRIQALGLVAFQDDEGVVDLTKLDASIAEYTARVHVNIECPCGLRLSERGEKVFRVLDKMMEADLQEVSLANLKNRVRRA